VTITDWLEFAADRRAELWLRVGEHVILTGVSVTAASVIGVPLGILTSRVPSLRSAVLGVVGILQTIPSLAMLVILLALFGQIGALPAIIALTLYALLPIVRNTLTGLDAVSDNLVTAARGIGMTGTQRLYIVELPLAMPVIMAGVRTAAVIGVGIATLSAFIGAGGLGQFINRGLALANTPLILLGAIPAAVLALIVDWSIAAAVWGADATNHRSRSAVRRGVRWAAVALPIIVIGGSATLAFTSIPKHEQSIRIGSKNFSEQFILGEMMAQLIEHHTDATVERRFALGGTMICHGAIIEDQIDIYPEYTGTAMTAVLELDPKQHTTGAVETIRNAYADRWNVVWFEPFRFNNTWAITVRRDAAEERGWSKISDPANDADKLSGGFTAEFSERPDGLIGLSEAYGLSFAEVRDMDAGLMYEAVARGQVDVICAFATDGRIAAYDLVTLKDDRGFFPPYHAAPVVRAQVLDEHPKVRELFAPLTRLLDDQTMRRLNLEVDEEGKNPRDVARGFLLEHGLIE